MHAFDIARFYPAQKEKEFVKTRSLENAQTIYTPAGLHIGAKTPQEIAISIIAEILAVTRNKDPFSLRNITGKIHSN